MNTNLWVFFVGVLDEWAGRRGKRVRVEARYEHHSDCLTFTSLPRERVEVEQEVQVWRKTLARRPKT